MIFAKASINFWISALLICFIVELIVLYMLGGIKPKAPRKMQFAGVTACIFGAGLNLIYWSQYYFIMPRVALSRPSLQQQIGSEFLSDFWVYPVAAIVCALIGYLLFSSGTKATLGHAEED